MTVDPSAEVGSDSTPNPSYSGDRIWVSKVAYDLMEPRRWDVIVFRYPEEAETYYIKRLIGLPGEKILIDKGDIYTHQPGDRGYLIARKPPEKMLAMAQVVHDNDYVSPMLREHDWPLRWQAWPAEGAASSWQVSDDTRTMSTDGKSPGEQWIRYRHILPADSDWFYWTEQSSTPPQPPRPQLITDFYAFNARRLRQDREMSPYLCGLHWVGDLILDCEVDVEGATGQVLLDLVKGGRHFGATIDVASGEARLSIDGVEQFRPTAITAMCGAGKYHVTFANVDRQLVLWIDDEVVEFDQPTTYNDLDNDTPKVSDPRGDDLAPLGIASRGLAMRVDHLRVLRDIYYIADRRHNLVLSDYQRNDSFSTAVNLENLPEYFSNPAEWNGPRNLFAWRRTAEFQLGADQFFVLGDNSPASSDARLWFAQHYVDRELLVGKALFIYWPHPLDLPIPLTGKSIGVIPNFPSMGFIR